MKRPQGPDFEENALAWREMERIILKNLIILTRSKTTGIDLTIRLSPQMTKEFAEKIRKAVARNVGVTFAVFDVQGDLGLIENPDGSREVRIAAYTGPDSFIPKTRMKGYHGKWNQAEIFLPFSRFSWLSRFVKNVKALIDREEKDASNSLPNQAEPEFREDEMP